MYNNPGPADTEEYQLRLVQEQYELDQKLNGRDHQGCTQIYQIQSELIRPNGREASRLDQTIRDENNSDQQFILLESQEIGGAGFELGGKKNTFVRRARTQRSPDHVSDSIPGNIIDKQAQLDARQMELELDRLELLLKLIAKKNVRSMNEFDHNILVRSPSF